jgi:S1-C subfamily serine protease
MPYQTAVRSSVYVKQGEEGHGSGVVVSDRCIGTVKHVGDTATSVVVGGREVVVKEVASSTDEVDAAVICADAPLGVPALAFAKEMPLPYSPLFKIGNPMNLHNDVQTGIYEGEDKMSVPVAPGDSGGGVFTADGHLIGFVDAFAVQPTVFGIIDFPHLSIMVKMDAVKVLLKQQGIPYLES